MIVLNKTKIVEKIVMTLTELSSELANYYIIVFENVTTKNSVEIVFDASLDLSLDKERYNEFEFDCKSYFDLENVGQWNYEVFESLDGVIKSFKVEVGKMVLVDNRVKKIKGINTKVKVTGYGG